MELPNNDGSRQRLAKRRKISLACEACRARKARCDGSKPRCGNCAQRLERCLYRVSNTQLADANEYIESLVGRISELEGVIQNGQNTSPPTPRLQPEIRNAPGPSLELAQLGYTRSELDNRDACHSFATGPPYISGSQNLPNRVVDPSSPVDAMGGTAIMDSSSEMSEVFYGSSSATSFMKQLVSMLSPADQGKQSTATGNRNVLHGLWSDHGSQQSAYCGIGDFSLMPRALSDHLVNAYWDKVYHLYPFLHKATFMVAYEQLWLPLSESSNLRRPGLGLGGCKRSGSTTSIFHCALNAVMVLGLQFSAIPPNERVTLTATLVLKAKSHFNLDMFDEGHIEVVQTLLLLVQVFQFTTFPTRCWSTIGAACRLAQGLGLHIPDNRAFKCLEPDEVDLRNRIWHSCLILDMVVSMTLGRPAILAYRAGFPLPNPKIVDGSTGNDQDEGQDQISELSSFVEAVKMYKTLSNVLTEIYGQNENHRPECSSNGYGSFDRLVELDEELVRFELQMPEPLRWTKELSSVHDRQFLMQQRNVLHARYLHLQLLLYRPTFIQFCRTHYLEVQSLEGRESIQVLPELSPANSFAHSTSIRCVKRSIDLIMLTYHFAATEATGAWWYNMFYTRTAAMVVFMAMTCPLVQDAIGETALNSAWEHCRAILVKKLPQDITVRRCFQTLENLHGHIFSFIKNRKEEHVTQSSQKAHTVVATNIINSDAGNTDGAQMDNFWDGLFDQSAFNFAIDDFGTSLL